MEEAEQDPVRIHLNAANLYIVKVGNLRRELYREDNRSEAAQILRSLIGVVRLHPIDRESRIELVGDITRPISFACDPTIKKPGLGTNPGSTEWLVAGTGLNEAPTFTKHV